MDYRRLNQTILRLMTPTATYMINVNVSTILRWSGKVYLLKICSAQKLAESVSVSLIKIKSVVLKNWQKQSQGSSAQKMAETESRLFCSKNGRNRHTHRQTDWFHRYIVVRWVKLSRANYFIMNTRF